MDVSFATLAAFLFFVFLVSTVSGLDTAVATRNALRRGTGAAILTAAGCSMGQLSWRGASGLSGWSVRPSGSGAA